MQVYSDATERSIRDNVSKKSKYDTIIIDCADILWDEHVLLALNFNEYFNKS